MISRHTFAAILSIVVLSSCQSASSANRTRPVSRGNAAIQWSHEWARGAVFYEIFVRSFADSDGDGIGDFNGLTAKLDYLNDGDPATTTDLGIDGIWLMPMFESTSYHGYDTTDYETVERDYGTGADFARFLAEAHKRGIRVIVDLVLNHTSVEHPWFIDSASSTTASRRDWYIWSSTDPGWKQPWGGSDPSWHFRNGAWYYGAFWGGMPDVNYRNADAKREMFRLTSHWLAQGVDGYRLDATRYLVEEGPGEAGQADTRGTHEVLRELSTLVRQVRPDAMLVAENTVDTQKLATYYGSTAVVRGGDEMPMNFNFPLASAVVEGVKGGDARKIAHALREMLRLYPRGVIDAPFLTNHDQIRIATVMDRDQRKLRSAAAILLTLPGVPFVYYGEEVGLQNGASKADEWKRTPMPWTPQGGFTSGTPWHPFAPGLATENVAAQQGDPSSLLSHYRNWIRARKSSAALMRGEIAPLHTPAQILAFLRESEGERVLVVHNLAQTAASTGPMQVNATSAELIFADGGVGSPALTAGALDVVMPPHSSAAWRIR